MPTNDLFYRVTDNAAWKVSPVSYPDGSMVLVPARMIANRDRTNYCPRRVRETAPGEWYCPLYDELFRAQP